MGNKKLFKRIVQVNNIPHIRFVEADFVVFDPVTGYWAYAEKPKLIVLITQVIRKEVKSN